MSKTPSKIGIQDVMAIFAVSHVTVYNWRKTGKMGKTLPTAPLTKTEAALPRPPVSFSLPTVLAWAKKAGIEVADKKYLDKLGTADDPVTTRRTTAVKKAAPTKAVAKPVTKPAAKVSKGLKPTALKPPVTPMEATAASLSP